MFVKVDISAFSCLNQQRTCILLFDREVLVLALLFLLLFSSRNLKLNFALFEHGKLWKCIEKFAEAWEQHSWKILGEFWEFSGKFWEILGNSGKFWEKLGKFWEIGKKSGKLGNLEKNSGKLAVWDWKPFQPGSIGL